MPLERNTTLPADGVEPPGDGWPSPPPSPFTTTIMASSSLLRLTSSPQPSPLTREAAAVGVGGDVVVASPSMLRAVVAVQPNSSMPSLVCVLWREGVAVVVLVTVLRRFLPLPFALRNVLLL